jgi:myo-inositol-1(or 4)-monophosphatase
VTAVAPDAAEAHRTSRFADDVEFARSIAEEAGLLLLERYERVERIDFKSAKDVVTEVDHLSEELILGAIRRTFPGDGILAEESGAHQGSGKHAHVEGGAASGAAASGDVAEAASRALAAGRTWIVDPLDGTVNYANGIPMFCVSIGLAIGGRPMIGVVYDPTRDEMFTAQAGAGARLDGIPIHHPEKEKLSDCVVSLSLPRRGWATRDHNVRKAIRVSRNMGSAALALTYLGNGRFDGFVQAGGLSLWDICAAGLIAIEGGARLTSLDGGPWFEISRPTKSIALLGAAPRHHQTLLEMLA